MNEYKDCYPFQAKWGYFGKRDRFNNKLLLCSYNLLLRKMTLAELFTEYNAAITATATEIAAWKTLDPVQIELEVDQCEVDPLSCVRRLLDDEDNAVVTSVGLFGADLTDFNADCVLLEDDCDIADYADYNGWGVGVNWESAEDVTADQVDGVAFATSKWTVQVTWDAATNVIESAISDEAIAEDAPTDADVELDDATDAFEGWAADAGDLEGAQFAFAFFEADTDFYFEAGDTEDVWATFGAIADVDGNVLTADFEFVGAASLTAATSVIVAALLF